MTTSSQDSNQFNIYFLLNKMQQSIDGLSIMLQLQHQTILSLNEKVDNLSSKLSHSPPPTNWQSLLSKIHHNSSIYITKQKKTKNSNKHKKISIKIIINIQTFNNEIEKKPRNTLQHKQQKKKKYK